MDKIAIRPGLAPYFLASAMLMSVVGESSERVAVVTDGLADGEEILLGMPEKI